MSEVDTRPPATRGRSSHRGGRGGLGRGGPRGGSRKPANGATAEAAQLDESFDDQGELGEMKKKYASELVMLKDMFPDYTNDDLVFALQEADGDMPSVVDRITQGNVSQFAEVKSAKDRARSKVKEPAAAAGATAEKPAARGARGRGGFEGTRGGRGRGSERGGRGAARGGRGGHTTNGTAAAGASIPTTEASTWAETTNAGTNENSWDAAPADATKETATSTWDSAPSTTAAPAQTAKSTAAPDGGAKKTWASMLAPKPAPVPVKKAPASEPVPVETTAPVEEVQKPVESEPVPPAPAIQEPASETPSSVDASQAPQAAAEDEAVSVPPPKVPLTEENVEHLPDDSHAPATQTVASTTGSVDPRNLTPLPGQQAPIGRPPVGGFAATAYRATGQPGRSASFQRRVQEQQEAVVMPGHNAVDRAAVQFGSMGLNGEAGPDVDEDREEPETRQAPQHSPPAQPRTSLPPAPRHMATAHDQGMPEALPTPKQAPGLPPASQQNQQQMQEATLAPGIPNEPSQMAQNYNQYGRYGQQGMQQDPIGQQPQKPYDPFSHQAQPSYDPFGSQAQQAPQQQAQQPTQSGFGGVSSAPDNYSNYYTADQQRNAYSQYYGGGGYGPQDVRSQVGQQDAGLGQQRSASGFGAGPNDAAFSSQAQQQVSIPPSLQQLSAQLNTTNDAHERQRIIEQIQHVIFVSSSHSGETARTTAPPMQNLNVRGNRSLDAMREDRFERPTPASAPLADVTNRKPPTPLTVTPKVNIPKAHAKQQQQSRFADPTNSGHNTPHPIMAPGQQSGANAQQSQHSMHQAPGSQQQQQGGYGSGSHYPYGHPSYNSPYAMAYQQQFSNYGGYSGYGSYGNKQGGMYGGSHGYGMGPQSSYDQHSASPANAGAFGQNQQASMRSVSGMSSGFGGLDDYARGSAQPSAAQQANSSAFGNPAHDPFARSASGFGAQNAAAYGQQSMAGQEDALKPFADASKSGPSPAPLGQPGRPASAANSAAGSGPQQQAQSGGFGGYGGFPAQSQYGGLGGLGSQQPQQQHGQGQQGAYGGYGGAGGFGQSYGSYNSRGGWGAQYGAH